MEKQQETALIELINSTSINPELFSTYTRLWQFETWLRHMVYVEYQAKYGDTWIEKVQPNVKKVSRVKENDKSLTHMLTPEDVAVSYLLFTDLCNAVVNDWGLFASYLPPFKIWEARIEEINQIRNRVAHFRNLHRDDYQRVLQLLRDVDNGFWRFCVSMNSSSPNSTMSNNLQDPVVEHFSKLNSWASRKGGNPEYEKFAKSIELSIQACIRPWASDKQPTEILGKQGYFYDVRIIGIHPVRFKTSDFLKNTASFHQSFVYLCFEDYENIIRLIIPTSLEKDFIISLIDASIRTALAHQIYVTRILDDDDDGSKQMARIQAITDEWAENILGPAHPLTYLSPDMPCSFFNV